MAGGILKFRKLVLGILFTLMLIVTIKSASSALTTNIYQHFKCDNATINGAITIDTTQNQNGTLTNGPTQNSTGFINQSHQTDGVNQYINANNTLNVAQSFSVCMWFYMDTQNTDEYLMRMACGVAGNWAHLYAPNVAGVYRFGTFDANWDNADSTTPIILGRWIHICGVHDTVANTNVIYINGTNETRVYNANNMGGASNHCYAYGGGGGKDLDGKIDEITLFRNRALNASAVFDIYNSTLNGVSYPWGGGPGPVNDDLNLSANPFPTRAQYNTNPVNVFATANATANWGCQLFVNGTLNQSRNLGIGTNVNCSFNITFTSVSNYTFYIRGNTTNVNETTSNGTIYFDNVNPIITPTNWSNNTIRYTQNITGQFNITDNFYLHRLNVTIDGIQIFGVIDINRTNYLYNLSYNISSLSPGNHILNITVADGHTANSIPDYDWSNGLFNDYLRYDMNDGYVIIEPIDGSIFDSFSTTKLKDRYTFNYEPSDVKKAQYQFKVTSDMPLHYAYHPQSNLEWLILGNHWLDFELLNENEVLDINLINKYEALITISNINNPEKMEFNSLGDLNVISRVYNFTTTNATMTYSFIVNELEYQYNYLNITKNGAVISTTAMFSWNGTFYTPTKTNTANYDYYNVTIFTPAINPTTTQVVLTWFFNITGPINNITANITNNQTIVQIGIDNCSTYTTRAINISLRDESNNSLVIGDIDGYFEVWIDILSQYRAFNLSWTGNSTYGLCINNASANYTTNAQLEYFAPTYDIKNYYFDNITLDNVTDILNLYLTRNTTQVTLRVSDFDDDVIQGVLIHIQSYDLGTNSYITTEIVRTDFQGRAFAEMILYSQWYQFMLVYQGNTILQTDATKLTSNTLNFQVDLGSNPLTNYNQVENMICAVSFNNATNNFRFDFNNPSGNTVLATLDVFNSTTYVTNLLNTSSVTSASGTILLSIGTPKNETYTGKGFVTINGVKYSCGSPESVKFGADYLTWGLSGIFYTFLLVVFFICVGIWSPAIAVLLLIIAIIITNLFGMFHLNTPYLISFIILGGITLYRLARTRI